MKALRPLLFVLVILSLATLACSTVTNFTKATETTEPSKPSTEVPTEAVTEKPPKAKILFEDDFSDSGSGWDQWTDDTSTTDYLNGTYQIFVGEANWWNWTNPYLDFTDVIVEVDVENVTSPIGDAGIICRYQDAENFYFLSITTDGYYGISKIKDGEEFQLTDDYPTTAIINTGKSINHLRAECIGSNLTLFANGTELVSISDADFSSGDVGLIGGSYEDAGVDLRFDNFVVTKP
ncbi:MAG TPA: hypothetical protein PLV24_09745 [Anaerolineaceae bacterium]|nr:hypothetical protein [Anaerolineaceae bacterium]